LKDSRKCGNERFIRQSLFPLRLYEQHDQAKSKSSFN
jgi:hypothetical protein